MGAGNSIAGPARVRQICRRRAKSGQGQIWPDHQAHPIVAQGRCGSGSNLGHRNSGVKENEFSCTEMLQRAIHCMVQTKGLAHSVPLKLLGINHSFRVFARGLPGPMWYQVVLAKQLAVIESCYSLFRHPQLCQGISGNTPNWSVGNCVGTPLLGKQGDQLPECFLVLEGHRLFTKDVQILGFSKDHSLHLLLREVAVFFHRPNGRLLFSGFFEWLAILLLLLLWRFSQATSTKLLLGPLSMLCVVPPLLTD